MIEDNKYIQTNGKRYQSNKLSYVKIVFNSKEGSFTIKLYKLSIMSKIKGNQDAVEVLCVLGIDVSKHYDNSFIDSHVFTTSLR